MKNTAYFFIVAFAIIATLIFGQTILVQLIFAFLFWFITREIRFALDKNKFIKKNFPKWLKNVLVFTLMIIGLSSIVEILSINIENLSSTYSTYRPNVDKILNNMEKVIGDNMLKTIRSTMDKFDYGSLFSGAASAVTGVFTSFISVVVYALFVFLEETNFKEKLRKVFVNKHQFDQTNTILLKIEKSVSNYLLMITLVSLLTGVLSFFVLLAVGVESPAFWAFLIFILNYIPIIGSMVATIFPAVFSILQFGELKPFFIVLLAVGAIQMVVGNYISPRLVGKSLNISPLVTLLSLAFWGSVWGIVGMLLSIPITVTLIIIFSHFKSTRGVAIMLSQKGNIA